MKIWCLFSVDNIHDQPDHNLVVWWQNKPTIETLAKAIGVEIGQSDEHTVAIVGAWTGKRGRVYQTDYYLVEVEGGVVL